MVCPNDINTQLTYSASPKNFSTMRRMPAPPPRRRVNEEGRNRSDSLLETVSTTAPALAPPGAGGLLQKNQHVSDVLNRARENSEAEKWDDDFAFDVTIPKITRELMIVRTHADIQLASPRP